ncbi:MAG TPA: hypothetical protein VF912_04115 [Anaeromyxobacter sp.]
MHGDRPRHPAIPRRGLLRALALAPAALAGCAAARGQRPGPAAGSAPSAVDAGGPAAADPAIAAVRAVRLSADAEPAFTFRAALARPGEPR